MKTIVHITTIPMSLTFLRGQVGYMKERGFEVHVLSSPGEDLDDFGGREDVPAHVVAMTRRISPLLDLVALARIRRVLSEVRPDIVHAHTPKGGLLGMIAAVSTRVPTRIYQVRGLPMLTARGFKRRLLRATEKIACRCAQRVLCNSHSILEVVVQEAICRPEKVKVLKNGSGNGVDALGRFNPDGLDEEAGDDARREWGIPSDATVVGFVGRLVREKGIVELAEAWRLLRDDFPGLHLLLVGPFETRDRVPGRAVEILQRDERVHLTGMDWDTPRLYAAMDLVVLPTYREGFPNVPLEAAAMGLPVVATRVPGCVDAVEDGVTGTLVEPRDAGALAAAIESYLRDPTLRDGHGERGRRRVLSEFRPEGIWEELFREYRLLSGDHEPALEALTEARA